MLWKSWDLSAFNSSIFFTNKLKWLKENSIILDIIWSILKKKKMTKEFWVEIVLLSQVYGIKHHWEVWNEEKKNRVLHIWECLEPLHMFIYHIKSGKFKW